VVFWSTNVLLMYMQGACVSNGCRSFLDLVSNLNYPSHEFIPKCTDCDSQCLMGRFRAFRTLSTLAYATSKELDCNISPVQVPLELKVAVTLTVKEGLFLKFESRFVSESED
jgi:hypothetical protein